MTSKCDKMIIFRSIAIYFYVILTLS